MADFSIALIHRLSQISDLTTLIGTRTYPQTLPEKVTFPALVYFMTNGPGEIRGHGERAGLRRNILQFDIWSGRHAQSTEIEDVIFKALDGTRGLWGTGANQIFVDAILAMGSPVDLPDANTRAYRITRDYLIIWKEI